MGNLRLSRVCSLYYSESCTHPLLQQAKFHIIQELLGKLHATVANSGKSLAYASLLEELNEERQKARNIMKAMFNKSFGATFLTDTGQESSFAYHIHQYADVYTSKPENFLFYPPEAWLHAPFDIKIMPHHVKVDFLYQIYKKERVNGMLSFSIFLLLVLCQREV